jgi:hypothetical protein
MIRLANITLQRTLLRGLVNLVIANRREVVAMLVGEIDEGRVNIFHAHEGLMIMGHRLGVELMLGTIFKVIHVVRTSVMRMRHLVRHCLQVLLRDVPKPRSSVFGTVGAMWRRGKQNVENQGTKIVEDGDDRLAEFSLSQKVNSLALEVSDVRT